MKPAQPKTLSSGGKTYRVKSLWVASVALNWPGHFAGLTTIDDKKCKGLVMHMESLEGFVFLEHQGAIAATNGSILVALEELHTPVAKKEGGANA